MRSRSIPVGLGTVSALFKVSQSLGSNKKQHIHDVDIKDDKYNNIIF